MIDLERLRGCGTALVTPFRKDESIDEEALRRLIEAQIAGGVHFLVACGTTGESVTMTDDEQCRVVQISVEVAAGRVPVVAGAGGYNTREVIHRIALFADLRADAILSVTPYYNKPTQAGLYEHFRAIAGASKLPIILYNVPGRTGCNLEPATVAKLAEIPGIIGIKEASGNISQIAEIIALVNESFLVLSGDDAMTLPVAALGGAGVISVVSNLLPDRVSLLTEACLDGDFERAAKLNRDLVPLFKALFIESNPIPIKAALAMTGSVEEVYRLPLVPLAAGNKTRLREVLIENGVIEEARRKMV
jgi:4-hydroxy-tetrahydrodipicolinate synthase